MQRFDPVVELVRLEESAEGSFGVLRVSKRVTCVTLEPPDMENAVGRSSIPAQQYRCVRHASPRFGETFAVRDVPGRSAILLHPGNTAQDTAGCILLGERFAPLDGRPAVRGSRAAFTAFMDALRGWDAFHLTISEHY